MKKSTAGQEPAPAGWEMYASATPSFVRISILVPFTALIYVQHCDRSNSGGNRELDLQPEVDSSSNSVAGYWLNGR